MDLRLHVRGEIQLIICGYPGNSIGDEGARALAESLKQNTTITQLNLCRYVRIEWIYVCMCVVRSS